MHRSWWHVDDAGCVGGALIHTASTSADSIGPTTATLMRATLVALLAVRVSSVRLEFLELEQVLKQCRNQLNLPSTVG